MTAPVPDIDLPGVAYRPPFLRIAATYPDVDGKDSTLEVEMNLGDGEDLADDSGDDSPVTSWITDFVTAVVAAMRRRNLPSASVVVTGPAAASVIARSRPGEDGKGYYEPALPFTGSNPAGAPVGGV